MIRSTLRLVFLALSLGACVRTRATTTAFRQLAPKASPADVQVFTDARPTRPFEELGLIEVSKFGLGDGYGPLIERARQEAARIGADAIIVTREPRETEVGSGHVSAPRRGKGQDIRTSRATVEEPRIRVTAIVFAADG